MEKEEAQDAGTLSRGDAPFQENSGRLEDAPKAHEKESKERESKESSDNNFKASPKMLKETKEEEEKEEAKDAGNLSRGDAPFEENSGRVEDAPAHRTEPCRPSEMSSELKAGETQNDQEEELGTLSYTKDAPPGENFGGLEDAPPLRSESRRKPNPEEALAAAEMRNLEVSDAATLLGTEMATKSAFPEGKSRRALVRLWQKEKQARGPAISPDVELGRRCIRGEECVPDLTPEKSRRALIRMKRRELTRRQVDVGRRCLNDASGRA